MPIANTGFMRLLILSVRGSACPMPLQAPQESPKWSWFCRNS